MTSKTTVIIRSLLRPTLLSSIESCKQNKLPVTVVLDGVTVDSSNTTLFEAVCATEANILRVPRSYGHYGCIAANAAIALADSEFVTFLDDDDELIAGASDILLNRFARFPDIDIWIPGAQLADGTVRCGPGAASKGLIRTNVVIPTYRASVFAHVPYNLVDSHFFTAVDYTDYWHICLCKKAGFTVGWLEEPIYLIRPRLFGSNGEGR